MVKLLFVCTGNTCRSPMAEGMFNRYAAMEGLDAQAESAGITPTSPQPPSKNAVIAAMEYGADISAHRAVRVDEAMIDACDAVLCMTHGHQMVLERMFPQYSEKILCLGAVDIEDPYGGDLNVYRAAAAQIAEAIRKLPLRSGKESE